MGNPHAPLTEVDYIGDPAEDVDRLEQWRAHVPEAISWLREQSALDLDCSVESLRLVWSWTIDYLARSGPGATTSVQQPPSWARWRPHRHHVETMRPERIWLWGALSAYFGEVFIARAAAPEVEWRILWHPIDNIQDQGELVLLRPAHISRGKPRIWLCPHVMVGNAIARQATVPDPRHRPKTGYNDFSIMKSSEVASD